MSSFYDDREIGWWIYQQNRRRKKMISVRNRPQGDVLPSGSSGGGSTPSLSAESSNITSESFDIVGTYTGGDVFAVLLANGATAPTALQVYNGLDSNYETPLDFQYGASGDTLSFGDLMYSTDYDVYVVGWEDGILSDVIKVDVSTIAVDVSSYDSDYQALLNHAITQGYKVPRTSFRTIENAAVLNAKSSGHWALSDLFYFLATDGDVNYAKLMIKDPTAGFNLVEEDSPLYFRRLGFRGVNAALDTGFIPSSDGANLQLNDVGAIWYTYTDNNINVVDFGARDATAQITGNARTQNTLEVNGMVNDNTNDESTGDMASSSIGLNFIERKSSTNKTFYKAGANTNITRTSINVPTVKMLLLARNNQGVTDAYSPRGLSFFSLGAAPDTLKAQIITDMATWQSGISSGVDEDTFSRKKIVVPLSPGEWDSDTIFGGAHFIWGETHVYYYSANNTADKHEVDMGAFNFLTSESGSKQGTAPILTRSAIGYGGAGEGFAPYGVYISGSTIYLFCAFFNDEASFDIGYLTADISDPYTFSTSPVLIITDYDTNHAPSDPIEDPTDSSRLLMAFAYKNTGNSFAIGIARANKSDLTSWTIIHEDVISSVAGGTNKIYPDLWFDGTNYHIVYSRTNSSMATSTDYAIWHTESSDISSFAEGIEISTPTEVASDPDGAYHAVGRVRRSKLYFNFRPIAGGSNSYQGLMYDDVYL